MSYNPFEDKKASTEPTYNPFGSPATERKEKEKPQPSKQEAYNPFGADKPTKATSTRNTRDTSGQRKNDSFWLVQGEQPVYHKAPKQLHPIPLIHTRVPLKTPTIPLTHQAHLVLTLHNNQNRLPQQAIHLVQQHPEQRKVLERDLLHKAHNERGRALNRQ